VSYQTASIRRLQSPETSPGYDFDAPAVPLRPKSKPKIAASENDSDEAASQSDHDRDNEDEEDSMPSHSGDEGSLDLDAEV
jgi:hypothetical protein